MELDRILEDWYWDHRRELPWKETANPYHIWLREVILQQTRVEQGREYYFRFLETFPTVQDLASADEKEVLKCWQGLGYYSRARNLHAAARYIVEQLGGKFPETYEEILKLKGVGKYTAAAIASFAYKLPYPVIDGNVYRFVARLYGIHTPIGTDTAFKEFEAILKKSIDKVAPDVFNQAIMDYGATVCKPTGCECGNCVFSEYCYAFKNGNVALLPIKGSKAVVRPRYLLYIDVDWTAEDEHYTMVHQRHSKDIWKGLYEFPLLEYDTKKTEEELNTDIRKLLGDDIEIEEHQEFVHKLTHQTIIATFVKVKIQEKATRILQNERPITRGELKKLPISRLIDRYLEKT